MQSKAVPLSKEAFAPFGMYYNMREDRDSVSHCKTDTYEDHMTKWPLLDTFGHLGLTIGEPLPYTVGSMEKHSHTEEALFCMGDPILIAVALARDNLPPQVEDLRVFLLAPGEVVVLNREVWHDAGRGIERRTAYYYLATAGAQPAVWMKVEGGEVEVVL